jgi:hypothetical protein
MNNHYHGDRDSGTSSSISVPYNQLNRSMPELALQQQQQQHHHQQQQYQFNNNNSIYSNNTNYNTRTTPRTSLYSSNNNSNSNINIGTTLPVTISKSTSNLASKNGDNFSNSNATGHHFLIENIDKLTQPHELRPVPRLCTIYKNESSHSNYSTYSSPLTSNIGFGVVQHSTGSGYRPEYLKINVVNPKSPAHLAGVDVGDQICEVNGRNALEMTPDETLHFIKVY